MPSTTQFQCGHCLHILGLPEKLVGRKIRCPMCGEPLTIPPPDPTRPFRKQNLAAAIEKFEISDWDRSVARTVLERGMVEEKPLYKAIIAVIKAAKKGPEIGLGEHLKTAGLIDDEACNLVRSLVRGTVKSEKEKFIECPNCFASVSTKARSCKFCGQAMGDVSVALCPNCKHEQASTLPRCQRCFADMKTGLRTGVELCPGCNRPVMGSPESCPHCKAQLREPTRRKRDRTRNRRVRNIKIAAAAALPVLILLWLLSGPVGLLLRTASVGYAQATLERRVEAFGDALKDNALDAIEGFVDRKAHLEIERDTRSLLLLGPTTKERVSRVQSITVGKVALNDKETAASVEIQASLKVEDKTVAEATRSVFGGGRSRDVNVTWHWVRRSGTWYFTPKRSTRDDADE